MNQDNIDFAAEESVSSTRASLGSSEYQHDTSSLEMSRPVSRSSNASGLSTTATKDGVEGKRLFRSRFSHLHDNLKRAVTNRRDEVSESRQDHETADMSSVVSLYSTKFSDDESRSAQVSIVNNMPPVSLKEKINLMRSPNSMDAVPFRE